MLTWIAENIATVLICLLLAVMVSAVTAKLIKDKKKGKSSCGCGCANCAMSGSCHGNK